MCQAEDTPHQDRHSVNLGRGETKYDRRREHLRKMCCMLEGRISLLLRNIAKDLRLSDRNRREHFGNRLDGISPSQLLGLESSGLQMMSNRNKDCLLEHGVSRVHVHTIAGQLPVNFES